MNNPFGIPDDLMTAAIVAAMKERSAQQQKNSKPENPFNVDTAAMAKSPQRLQSSFTMPMLKLASRRNRLLNWLRVS